MKNRLQNILRSKFVTLCTLALLTCVSQDICAWSNMYVYGQFNNWTSTQYSITGTDGADVYLLGGKTYEFKLYSTDNNTSFGITNHTITASVSDCKFYSSNGNCKIQANKSGFYNFKCTRYTDVADPEVKITFPSSNEAPDDLYIKGPLVNDTSWGNYTKTNVGYKHTSGTNTFVFSFVGKTGNGGYSGDNYDFCISTNDQDINRIHDKMDTGRTGWSFKSESGTNFKADNNTLTINNSAIINIVITYNTSTDKYTMVLANQLTPTVLIAADEVINPLSPTEVTLYGYVKYNGCKTISEYGFVYGTGNTPTTSDNKVKVGENDISRGSSYSKTFEESTNATYNYRAYIIAGSTTYYSSEIRQFTIDFTCDLSSLDATIDGGSSSVKVFSSGTPESATLSSVTFANVYHWECTSENSSHVTFENANQRETTVTVSEEGMYTFRLGAKCTGDANYTYSENVTLYTCAKPDGTLLLDGYSANILCQDEMATATIKSRSGYTYTLYRGETEIASLTGNGRTLKWHNVEGEGTFTVKAHPTALPACTHTLSSATQSYNIPNIGIDISPASAVPAFTPVTLTKSDASTIDKEPFWEITEGASTGYLLNGSTSIQYDDRARHSVIFKGGLVVESNEEVTTFYKVKAKGYKKVNLGTGDNATTKECESSVVIELSTFKASPCQ